MADDAVTGDDDGKRIAPVGMPNSTHRIGFAEALGQFAIRNGRPKGNALQLLPDAQLECGTSRSERYGEMLPLAGKVFLELSLYRC